MLRAGMVRAASGEAATDADLLGAALAQAGGRGLRRDGEGGRGGEGVRRGRGPDRPRRGPLATFACTEALLDSVPAAGRLRRMSQR